ncbi:FAD-dependent oxidoreductase [Bacillus sp. SM-B1]|uniref:FAD-dependent oxidoreductase n=1 Tax=Bacillus sp. SM-B1 TaxID=2980102 RepID=UPI002949806E|nr:FAD-dependent oxidoreductase [Bacillus sp. SM-B1]MDV6040425.1 FAD-dependent oxidoreductase [Bacillus sp. SM-B1]
MKIIVIGSVAAGTSVAAKARRNTETAQITIYDRDTHISYSGCGIPYYLGPDIETVEELTPRDAKWFKKRYNIDIHTQHEVMDIDLNQKQVTVKNLVTNEDFIDTYDKLVIATGASPIVPPIAGIEKENVFSVRNIQNAQNIKQFLVAHKPKKAVIVGGGFIGLEVAEAFIKLGMEVTLIDREEQVMSSMDKDVTAWLEKYMNEKSVKLLFGETVTKLEGDNHATKVVTNSGKEIETDIVILSIGVRPNTQLATKAGITLGETRAIQVNTKMETNVPDIYAVGDCAESFSLITKKAIYRPLGSTANKMGRIAGDVMTGGTLEFRGILGTGIFKFFDMAVAQTGLSEKEARSLGYDIEVLYNIKPNKPAYMEDSSEMVIKAIANRKDSRVLGVQIAGKEGVDKRIDVFVTAMTFGAKAEDLFHLDLAYAPPFSTTKDPVMYTGMALDNAIQHNRKLITPSELKERIDNGEQLLVIDARSPKDYEKSHVPNAINISLGSLREKGTDFNKDIPVVTYCNKGVTGNAAQNVLLNLGFKEVYNLSGGNKNYQMTFPK